MSTYLDYNATSPMVSPVIEAMLPYLQNEYGNPSSFHKQGAATRKAITEARESIASQFHTDAKEILFTSGGTEAINLAIKGTVFRHHPEPIHIIACETEHKAVLASLDWAKAFCNVEVTLLSVDPQGLIDVKQLKSELRDNTALIALMWVNNETGVLSPVTHIGNLARKKNIPFFCDGVQAVGKVPIDLSEVPIDMMSFSAHKFHGPKGVGGLYVRKGVRLAPLIHGGDQERERRGGTENVASIVGMAKALDWVYKMLPSDLRYMEGLRDRLIQGFCDTMPQVRLNGAEAPHVPNTVNVTLPGLSGQSLLMALDQEGVSVSQGSACASGAIDPSHVLLAMGLSPDDAKGSLRISLGRTTKESEIDFFLDLLPRVVAKLQDS
jgi:cysteine desulfurase